MNAGMTSKEIFCLTNNFLWLKQSTSTNTATEDPGLPVLVS